MRLKHCLLSLALGTTLAATAPAGPIEAAQTGEPTIVAPGVNGAAWDVAYNPERDEYLAVYRQTSPHMTNAVLLNPRGETILGPFDVTGELGGLPRYEPSVSYNATSNQYLISWHTRVDEQSVTFGRLVSDTGGLVGGPVQLHATLGTNDSCASVYPQHEANPATGGYTLLYTYWYATTTDVGPCNGLAPAESRAVVASLGPDLSLGTSVNVPGTHGGIEDDALSVNPRTGDVLVATRGTGRTGLATLLSPSLDVTGSVVLDTDPQFSRVQDISAASDPETGNWLVTWKDPDGGGVSTVIDGAGETVVAPDTRLSSTPADMAAASDGSFWGVTESSDLIHVAAEGSEISKLRVHRTSRPAAIAIGTATTGVSGMVFGPNLTDFSPTATPFSETPVAEPLAPARLLETRTGTPDGTVDGLFEGIGARRGGTTLELQVGGRGGVPAGADAAFLNIAAAQASNTGFVTAFPCGGDLPTSSNLNFRRGAAASSAAFVKLSDDGKVCLFTSVDVDLIVDVNGFVPPTASVISLDPARLLETRPSTPNGTIDDLFDGEGRRVAGSTLELTVAGRGGVDADAESVLINVTAVRPERRMFVTVYPCGQPQPTTASLNAEANVNATNLAFAKVGDGGKVCLFASAATDLIVDVSAYVPADGGVIAQTPERLVESREGTPDGTIDGSDSGLGRLTADSEQTFTIAGRGSVPVDAIGAMLNVAAINADTNGFITLFPCDERPNASNVNFAARTVVSNGVFVALSPGGDVCVYTSTGTDLAIDVTGYVSQP